MMTISCFILFVSCLAQSGAGFWLADLSKHGENDTYLAKNKTNNSKALGIGVYAEIGMTQCNYLFLKFDYI